jgi:hypothetical protein
MMKQVLLDAYKELFENCNLLEEHYKQMMVQKLHYDIVPYIFY